MGQTTKKADFGEDKKFQRYIPQSNREADGKAA